MSGLLHWLKNCEIAATQQGWQMLAHSDPQVVRHDQHGMQEVWTSGQSHDNCLMKGVQTQPKV
jgi:hypothetical protein